MLILPLLTCHLNAESNSFYRGQVGGSDILVALNYDQKQVKGIYKSLNSGKTYYLKGDNKIDGRLFLKEYIKKGSSLKAMANVTLHKSTSSGRVVWSGTMKNYDGRNVKMTFTKSSSLNMNDSLSRGKKTLDHFLGNKPSLKTAALTKAKSNTRFTKNSRKSNLIDQYGLSKYRGANEDHISHYIAQADQWYKIYSAAIDKYGPNSKYAGEIEKAYANHKKSADLAKTFHLRTKR